MGRQWGRGTVLGRKTGLTCLGGQDLVLVLGMGGGRDLRQGMCCSL